MFIAPVIKNARTPLGVPCDAHVSNKHVAPTERKIPIN